MITVLLLVLCFGQSSSTAARAGASSLLDRRSKSDFISLRTEVRQQSAVPASVGKRRGTRSRKGLALRKPDVIYYPTPEETVAEMLRLANINPGDVLYDLGSGDGRIPIMAAQKYGIRAIGIEIDPKLVALARERAQLAQVAELVNFRNDDMFRTDIGEATVVTLYLSNKLNLLLRPKLLRELRPGTRILSHDFHMGDWQPEQTVKVPWQGNLYRTVYLWTVPPHDLSGKKKKAK
ncbi:MAG: SAM-dependent methyltransferase [Pyrinomonadaceae bacterium]